MEIKAILSGLLSLAPGLKAINALIKESRGQQRELLRELQNNINAISVFVEGGAAAERLPRLIADLQVSCYEQASKAGFDFNSLQKDKLKASLVADVPQFKTYAGLNTEQLFEKLYSWIHRLKIIARDYADDPKFRMNVRLFNIWKLMLVMVKHINAQSR